MCTVTALPSSLLASDTPSEPLLLRVACNRDERVTRAPALPPTVWAAGSRRALMPIDPSSGGTWIAANDAGLVFVLLNASDGRRRGTGDLSRGAIIPMLIGSVTSSQALSVAERMPVQRFAPFRLLILNRYEVVESWREGDRLRHHANRWRGAWLRTSSSLGDDLVSGPRRTLFQRLLREQSDPRHAQECFHRHRWPGRQAISVDMQRHDARTVSRTIVEVRAHSVTLAYQAIEWPQAVAVRVAA